MLFNGEEAGLLGSAFFVKSELFKKYNIVIINCVYQKYYKFKTFFTKYNFWFNIH